MQKIYTHTLGAPIVRYSDGLQLAKVQDLIVDAESGKIEAVWVKKGGSWFQNAIITVSEILEWKIKVYVQDEEVFADPEDLIRVQKILDAGIPIYKNHVYTKAGEYLGSVADFSFDTKSFAISQLYTIKYLFGLFPIERRVIPKKEIIEILADRIIVKEDIKPIRWKRKKLFSMEDILPNIDPAINQTSKKDLLS